LFYYLKDAQFQNNEHRQAEAADAFNNMYAELSSNRTAFVEHMKVGHFSHITWTVVYDMLTDRALLAPLDVAGALAVAEVARFVKEVVDEYTAAAM